MPRLLYLLFIIICSFFIPSEFPDPLSMPYFFIYFIYVLPPGPPDPLSMPLEEGVLSVLGELFAQAKNVFSSVSNVLNLSSSVSIACFLGRANCLHMPMLVPLTNVFSYYFSLSLMCSLTTVCQSQT